MLVEGHRVPAQPAGARVFAIVAGAHAQLATSLFFPLAILMQAVLIVGVGLIVAPLVVFFRDLERAIKLALRFLFYASPIIYGTHDLPDAPARAGRAFNPLTGIFGLYRVGVLPRAARLVRRRRRARSCRSSLLGVGFARVPRRERAVLKEI